MLTNILNDYNSILPTKEIAKKYNISHSVLYNILDRLIPKADRIARKKNKYNINENYFDAIDTQNKAYFLGLLYADGNNYRAKTFFVSLKFNIDDKELLEAFQKDIGSDKPLYFVKAPNTFGNSRNQMSFIVSNKHISDKLNEYGMVPRKSLIVEFPTCFDDKYLPHFIRGYMDGDGAIMNANNKRNQNIKRPGISICGSLIFLTEVSKILLKKLEVNSAIRTKAGNKIHELTIGSKHSVLKFLNWIYNDAEIFLKRKHDKYLEVVKTMQLDKIERNKYDDRNDKIINLFIDGMCVKNISKEVGIKWPVVYYVLNNAKTTGRITKDAKYLLCG